MTAMDDHPLPPEYDYDDEGSVIPSPPDLDAAAPGQRRPATSRQESFVALKPFPKVRLDHAALLPWLRRQGFQSLADDFKAFESLAGFERRYIRPLNERVALPQVAPRSCRLPPRLHDEIVGPGRAVVFRLAPGSPQPLTCALRCVPDRKRPELGRVIYPLIATNERSVEPDPAPIPLVPAVIRAVTTHLYRAGADFRGWFHAAWVATPIAMKYFASRLPARAYAHRHRSVPGAGPLYAAYLSGLMGWCHMPSVMARLAVAMATVSATKACGCVHATWRVPEWLERLPSLSTMPPRRNGTDSMPSYPCCPHVQAVVYVDGVDYLSNVKGLPDRCLQELDRLSAALGAELHDREYEAHAVRNGSYETIGLEVEPSSRRWRVRPSWASAFTQTTSSLLALTRGSAPRVTLLHLWRAAGGAVWVTSAEMLPLTWIAPLIDTMRSMARAWLAGRLALDSVVAIKPAAADSLRGVLSHLAAARWRSVCVAPGRPICSDASLESGLRGLGAFSPVGTGPRPGYTRFASGTSAASDGDLIATYELMAADEGHVRSSPQPGHAVPFLLDNQVVVAWLRRGYTPVPAAVGPLRAILTRAAARGEGLDPRWVPSHLEPADAPSREHACSVRPARSSELAAIELAAAHAEPVMLPGATPVQLPLPGWFRPLPTAPA